MKNIDLCVFKEKENFYLDLIKWSNISDIPIQIGDIFSFILENKKFLVKVIDVNSSEATLDIL
jgi:hypothetical protein